MVSRIKADCDTFYTINIDEGKFNVKMFELEDEERKDRFTINLTKSNLNLGVSRQNKFNSYEFVPLHLNCYLYFVLLITLFTHTNKHTLYATQNTAYARLRLCLRINFFTGIREIFLLESQI